MTRIRLYSAAPVVALLLLMGIIGACGKSEPESSAGEGPAIETTEPSITDRTFVHLFEWDWPSVATECEKVLGPAGYAAVQVSPPMEHVVGPQWWTRYHPVSYQLVSRSGDRVEFGDMVSRCKAAGVDIYVEPATPSPAYTPVMWLMTAST